MRVGFLGRSDHARDVAPGSTLRAGQERRNRGPADGHLDEAGEGLRAHGVGNRVNGLKPVCCVEVNQDLDQISVPEGSPRPTSRSPDRGL